MKEEISQIRSQIKMKYPDDHVIADSDDWMPNLLWISKSHGLVAIEFSTSKEDDVEVRVRLNRKINALQESFTSLTLVGVERILVVKKCDDRFAKVPPKTHFLELAEFLEAPNQLPSQGIDASILEELTTRLEPAMTFAFQPKTWESDLQIDKRLERRITLDAEQASAAQFDESANFEILGPPGSGKSLVLAARAKWIAQNNPSWHIAVVVFNKSLETYFHTLLGAHRNISVTGFHSLARKMGHRMGSNDDARAINELRKLKQEGITPCFDTILIDEFQDYSEPWFDYLRCLLKPLSGGITVAGDLKQAIYQERGPARSIRSLNPVVVELNRSYRSTREILRFTASLDEAFGEVNETGAPEGLPVDLVHAPDWNAQADAAVWEVRNFIRDAAEAESQIAILVTRKSLLSRVAERLEDEEIAFVNLADRDGDGAAPEIGRVTVGTVHASKGLEFDNVVLLGLDVVKPLFEEDEPQRSRIAYVGPTRARNRLIALYSKGNQVLTRLAKIDSSALRHWEYPDDYELEG